MSQSSTYLSRQPWIHHPLADGLFVVGPALFVTLAVLIFPDFFESGGGLSPLAWLVLIVGIDVAHVYSTLYRTYFDGEEFRRYKKPLILIPILSWLAGSLLYLLGGHIFWTVLAYLAVYHFVRQQYGFFAIYARKENRNKKERILDQAAIYGATLYPLIYWHTHLPRQFNWFVEGDFLAIPYPWFSQAAGWTYLGILAAYGIKEFVKISQKGFNLPKNLILIGTAASWYCGIVLYEGDLAFTATNVISHGIPYMALIWFYGQKKKQAPSRNKKSRSVRIFFRPLMLPIFVGLLMVFGYLEEGLWDGLVWRDHTGLFPWADALPYLTHPILLAIVVPLLAVPQATHYVIDGFIWRMRKEKSELNEMMGNS